MKLLVLVDTFNSSNEILQSFRQIKGTLKGDLEVLLLKVYTIAPVPDRNVVDVNDDLKQKYFKELSLLSHEIHNELKTSFQLKVLLKIGSLKNIIPRLILEEHIDFILGDQELAKASEYVADKLVLNSI
tara:strand:+ start:215 stop:601 length:387 start_codon:yes stop_codon:yes gene_type:complete